MKAFHFRSHVLFFLLAAVVITTSCATVGRDFPADPVKLIENGKTTRQDIRTMFGEPWRTGMEDGKKTWTYGYYRYRLFGETVTRDLLVRFDDRGTVVSYTFSTSEIME